MQGFLLVYRSLTLPTLTKPAMRDIVERAQQKNRNNGISGFLVWKNSTVVQALLGSRQSVENLFAAIAADKRHTSVTKLFSEIDERAKFPDWSMQFWDLDIDAVSIADRQTIQSAFQPYQRTIMFAGMHI